MSVEAMSQRSKLRNTTAREQSKEIVSADAVALLLGLAESPPQKASPPERVPSPVSSSEPLLLPTQTKRKHSSASLITTKTATTSPTSEGRSSQKKRKVSPQSPAGRRDLKEAHKGYPDSSSIQIKHEAVLPPSSSETTLPLSPSSSSTSSSNTHALQSHPSQDVLAASAAQNSPADFAQHMFIAPSTTPSSQPSMMTQPVATPNDHGQIALDNCFPDSQTVSHFAAVEQQIRRQMVLTELQAAVAREQRMKQVNAILNALSVSQRSQFMNTLSSSLLPQSNPSINSFQTMPPFSKAQWPFAAAPQVPTQHLIANILRQSQLGLVGNPFQQHQLPFANSNLYDMGAAHGLHAPLPNNQISAFLR